MTTTTTAAAAAAAVSVAASEATGRRSVADSSFRRCECVHTSIAARRD